MRPETEAELSECVASATGPLSVRSGGTRGVSCDGDLLDASGLIGVSLYEPGALTLVAQAGTPLVEVDTLLAGEGQRLAFEPADYRGLLGTEGTPTLGGMVAANMSGPRRVNVGACRDFLLGVRFVNGMGQIVSNGGRVMKNVTGYDLVKLMAGSWGTLGVLSEVSLKVMPVPEMAACVLINGLSDEDALAAMSRALGSPYDVTGAAHAPAGVDGHPVTMLRLEGFEASVNYRAAQLKDLLDGSGEILIETDQARLVAGWRWVRDVELFHGREGNIWRVSVKPSDAPALVAAVGPKATLFDWGGGLVWMLCASGTDVRASMTGIGGHATLVRGNGFARFPPEPAGVARLSAGVQAKFDPRGILNAGLMG